jgi:hypothetical protein
MSGGTSGGLEGWTTTFYKAPAAGFYDAGNDEAVRPKLKQRMRSDVSAEPG